MKPRHLAHAIVVAALLLLGAAVSRVDAGDETCYPIEVTWYSPSGVAGCTLDGPTAGIASTYPGDVAAANWCTWPWTDCGWVRVQSHATGLTIEVPVGMYCDCWWTSDRRLVDLTPGQVRALGLDPADGLFAVTVTPYLATVPEPGVIDPASAGGGVGGEPVAALPTRHTPPAPLLPDTATVP